MNRLLLFLFLALNLISCSALMEENSTKKTNNSLRKSSSNLKSAISNARYDLDNIQIYSNIQEYMGTIISTQGIFIEQKFLKDKDKKFVITGSNTGYAGDFIVYLDHPLQKQTRIGENVQVISTASGIRVFGRFKGLEEYLSYDGVKKQLPVLEAIAIFNIDDRDCQNPVWVNLLYE